MRAALADALSFDVELFEDVMKKFKPFDVHSLERSIPPCLQNVSADFVVDESVQMLWDWAEAAANRMVGHVIVPVLRSRSKLLHRVLQLFQKAAVRL